MTGELTMDGVLELNERFGLSDEIVVRAGPGRQPVIEVTNCHATATLALQGAHVCDYEPRGERPVLWLSRQTEFAAGKAIRGGIPVCWPWFGRHPERPDLPSHGLARTRSWSLEHSAVTDDGGSTLRLVLRDDAETRELWPFPFELALTVTVGPALILELSADNKSDKSVTLGGALHSYFAVSDVRETTVQGLEGTHFIDKTRDGERPLQEGEVRLDGPADRIYLNTTAACRIEDPSWSRVIHVRKHGSRSTVVWNPWRDGAVQLADMGDDEWPGFLCVETANAGDDQVTVPPGEVHRLGVELQLEH